MVKKQASFAGLRKLAARMGMTSTPAPLDADGAENGEDEEKEDDNEPLPGSVDDESTDVPAGDPPVDDEDGDDETETDDEGEDDGSDVTDTAPVAASADFTRGYNAAQGRWAATFLSASCRGNLELATDLLAETDLSPKKIAAMCATHTGGSSTALKLLDATPKVNLGGGGVQKTADVAAASRSTAVARANKLIGAKGKKARTQLSAKGV